jgi:hypothetical protein
VCDFLALTWSLVLDIKIFLNWLSDIQKFISGGRQLENKQTLGELKIGPGDTIDLVLRLRGGGHLSVPPEAFVVALFSWSGEMQVGVCLPLEMVNNSNDQTL